MFRHYLLLSAKVLLRRRFFTFISIFGISFTLLVLMVVAALLDHNFAPGVPETRQDRIVASVAASFYSDQGGICCGGGLRLYDTFARDLPGAERLSIFSSERVVDSYVEGRKIQSSRKHTDADFWQILDFQFIEGRPYSAAEVAEAAAVAVINRQTRERFFGNQPATGKTIEADGQRYRVVGVVENVSSLRSVPHADIWAPYTTIRNPAYKTGLYGGFNALILASTPEARVGISEEFNARVARIDAAEFDSRLRRYRVVAPFETKIQAWARNTPFADARDPAPQTERAIAFVLVAFALFILLPTVNLVNINVSRILERASEIGVRKAFGASRLALVGQFVTENVVLTMVGGLLGFVLSAAVLSAITRSGWIAHAQFGVNPRVFLYGLALAAVFGIISGVYPAWRLARLHPVDALKGGTAR
jgi:putative ABC transport system permease protein